MRRVVWCLMFLFISTTAQAEVIRLKDGTKLHGTIGAWNADGSEFYFDPAGEAEEDRPRWIAMAEVAAIRYDGIPAKAKDKMGDVSF